MGKFSGAFVSEKRIQQVHTVEKDLGEMKFIIESASISYLPEKEVQRIISVVLDELEHVHDNTADIMAERIVEESNISFLRAATIDGGPYGCKWHIRLSAYPHELKGS